MGNTISSRTPRQDGRNAWNTPADDSGQAWFTDKAATHKASGGDPVCASKQIVDITTSTGVLRLYCAMAIPGL